QLHTDYSDQGARGIRHDSAALVALEEGSYTLPALRVHWWNTLEDRLETATLDSVVLNVSRDTDFGSASPPVNYAAEEPALLWPWPAACTSSTAPGRHWRSTS